METKYLGAFETREDIEKEFECKIPKEAKILMADYDIGNWEGQAFVLYQLDGKLYEVNGSHCSCCGLEGQWEPEETSIKYLRETIKNGTKYNISGKELTEVLDEFEKENHESN